jgi:hypothetical protein
MARHHRAPVAKARQQAAKPMLKNGDGWDVPCQPRRNSSINLNMGTLQPIGKAETRPKAGLGQEGPVSSGQSRSASPDIMLKQRDGSIRLKFDPAQGP